MIAAVTAFTHCFHDVQKDTFVFRTAKSFSSEAQKVEHIPGRQIINMQPDSRFGCQETSRRLLYPYTRSPI
jgi:hypothetical protein